MTELGLYHPGGSPVHRARPGAKLLVLGAGLFALTAASSPAAVVIGAFVVSAVGALARLPWRVVAAQVRSLRALLVLLAASQWWFSGWRAAVVVCGTVTVSVLAAALVTLTTRTTDLLDTVVAACRPLRRFGVDGDRVALVLALTLRAVPVLAEIVTQVHQARLARGAHRSVRAFAVPVTIRAVRYADRLGEALVARGVDD